MKYSFLAVALLLLMGLAPAPVSVDNSVVRLQFPVEVEGDIKEGGCTGFYVRPNQILTARHCVPEKGDMYTDGIFLRLIKENSAFALYETPIIRQALPIAKPRFGETLRAIGNAYSQGLVILNRVVVKLSQDHHIWVDGSIAFGMSGGPLVNDNGEVVGLMQATNETFGIACGAEELKDFIK